MELQQLNFDYVIFLSLCFSTDSGQFVTYSQNTKRRVVTSLYVVYALLRD